MGTSVWQIGDNETARRAYEESLRLLRSVGDENMAAHPIGTLGFLAFDRGERERGRKLVEESVARFRAFNDHHYLALQLHRGGDLACADGDAGAAYRAYRESLTLAVEAGASDQVLYALGVSPCSAGCPGAARARAPPCRGGRRHAGHYWQSAQARGTARLEQALTTARADLGSAAEAAWQRGRRMSAQEAVDFALDAVGRAPKPCLLRPRSLARRQRMSDPAPTRLMQREHEAACFLRAG